MNIAPVTAVLCPDRESFDAAGPGAIWLWRFAEKEPQGGASGHAMVKCPGCGSESGMHLRKVGEPHPPDRESWEVSGIPDAITFAPSVNCTGCCGWHGHLVNGVYKHI